MVCRLLKLLGSDVRGSLKFSLNYAFDEHLLPNVYVSVQHGINIRNTMLQTLTRAMQQNPHPPPKLCALCRKDALLWRPPTTTTTTRKCVGWGVPEVMVCIYTKHTLLSYCTLHSIHSYKIALR